ncbi:MAG: hypothetical protein WC511_00500 [Candidatus Pacearchaeota archaeon]
MDETKFQEIFGELSKFPTTPEYDLDTSFTNVMALLDFMVLIQNHKDELKDPLNIEVIKKGFNPGAILLDYIIQEISTFYTNVYLSQKKGNIFPELPSYWEDLKKYRDEHPAHRNKEHKLKNLADQIKGIISLEVDISMLKIVEDFRECFLKIKSVKK